MKKKLTNELQNLINEFNERQRLKKKSWKELWKMSKIINLKNN